MVNTLFPNFIFVWDEDFHYVDVITPDGLRLFHTREELIGQDARQFYTPEVSELLIANIRECLKTNKIKEVEHHIELQGARYYYQARIVPVDGDKVYCLIQDVSDRVRRMEELLTQRQRAEEMNKMKSALIENLSHEIRTPLNAVVGFSEFLVNEMVPEIRQKYVGIVRNNNGLLLQIINDILDLSRLEAEKSVFSFEEADIVSIMTEVVEENIFKTKPGVKLIPHLPAANITVYTDGARLKQVLNNLVSNSIKFTDKGTIILNVEENDEFLTFSVEDTGSGIPVDKLGFIFERFEKLNRFTQGTGLGLAICRAIAEKLGGKITVSSEINKGSLFSFHIPYRHHAFQKTNIGSVRELMTNQKKKIMIVETAVDDMESISKTLSQKYEVIEITEFDKIVASFILDQPNLVIMNMEAVSKKETITKIRAISPTIPIIAMTTSDFYHDQRWALENGCTEVIAKPFSPSRLEEIVLAFVV